MNKKNITTTKSASQGNELVQVEFTPFGATDPIKLSVTMIRQFIAIPTKSGALPNERDCLKFLMLCRGKRANPFEGDCFMIGYDGQDGPVYSIVCGIELFFKRAEWSEKYNGIQYGVIIETTTSEIPVEREGALVEKDETLIGGWAKVYRKDRQIPIYKRVKLETYNTGKSRWGKDPGGMIAKVAASQALRESFPTALGGLYTQEEMIKVTEIGDGITNFKKPVSMPKEITHQEEEPPDTPPVENSATLGPPPQQGNQGQQSEMNFNQDESNRADLLTAAEEIVGEKGDDVTQWALNAKKINQGQTWKDMGADDLEIIIKSKDGFSKMIENYMTMKRRKAGK